MKKCLAMSTVFWIALSAAAFGVEPGKWIDVTPSGIGMEGNDNYGVQDILVDPTHLNTLYAFTCRYGVWKSTDFGLTWKKISLDGGPLDQGKSWGSAMAPDGSFMLTTLSGSKSMFKSTDGGVHWIPAETTIHPYNVEIDPNDKKHAISTGHDETHLIESLDAGKTWIDQGAMGGVSTSGYVHFLLDGNTVLAVSADSPAAGTWRGVKSNSKWTWTKVSSQDHDHGSHQLFVDRIHKTIFNPGAAPGLGIQKSTDNGLTWTSVSKQAADAIIPTPTALYACRSFPFQRNVKQFDPHLQHASRPAGTDWTSDPTPSGMTNGAKQFAVTFDGSNHILVSGNWRAGIWRYVEPAPTARPAPAPLER